MSIVTILSTVTAVCADAVVSNAMGVAAVTRVSTVTVESIVIGLLSQ